MTEREWERFDELLDEIVNDENKTFLEKKEAVIANVNQTNLEEFLSWFAESSE